MITKPIQTVGRRKSSIAHITLQDGSGIIKINGKSEINYFQNHSTSLLTIERPFSVFANQTTNELENNSSLLTQETKNTPDIPPDQSPIPILKQNFDLSIHVVGGGLRSQSEAIQLGIARAICKIDINYRSTLKREKLLTRDPRCKERKKYGLKKSRKASQFSKR